MKHRSKLSRSATSRYFSKRIMATLEEHAAHSAEFEKRILNDVEKYGFHVAMIDTDGYSPSFAYTIGLFKSYGYPELICFGLSLELLHSVLWAGKELLDKQRNVDLTLSYANFLEGYNVRLVSVNTSTYPEYFGYAKWFYKNLNFPILQIVWPDKQGVFPWQKDFNSHWKCQQPLLDRSGDFKFREERNLSVFTTQQVLAGAPILRVLHETDGDWQFLCTTTTDIDDLCIVTLEEIVKHDASLNSLYQLNYGWVAERASAAAKWQTWKQEPEKSDE